MKVPEKKTMWSCISEVLKISHEMGLPFRNVYGDDTCLGVAFLRDSLYANIEFDDDPDLELDGASLMDRLKIKDADRIDAVDVQDIMATMVKFRDWFSTD